MQLLINTENPQSIIFGTFNQILECGLVLRNATWTDLTAALGISWVSLKQYKTNGFPERHIHTVAKFLNAEITVTSDHLFILILK